MKSGQTFQILLVCAIAAPLLGGCSGAKKAFGMGKVSPDEFTIVTKAPLVVPPDYSLRPPRPGMASLSVTQPGGRAEYALFGNDGDMSNAQGYTTGEIAFLEISGGASADPNIRKLVNAETASLIEKDQSIADDILFWQEPALPGEVIDPVEETRRLEEKTKDGENTGSENKDDKKDKDASKEKEEEPKAKKKGILGGLF